MRNILPEAWLTSLIETLLVVEYGDIHYAPGVFDPPTDWITANPDSPPAWSFTSLPCPDMGNQTAFVQAGQVVGGSSAVNGMFFDRGSRFDYDAWAEVGGPEFANSSTTWNWDTLFPYFKKVSPKALVDPTPTSLTVEISERYIHTAEPRYCPAVQLHLELVCLRGRYPNLCVFLFFPVGRPAGPSKDVD
jgi:hypothetical protein